MQIKIPLQLFGNCKKFLVFIVVVVTITSCSSCNEEKSKKQEVMDMYKITESDSVFLAFKDGKPKIIRTSENVLPRKGSPFWWFTVLC